MRRAQDIAAAREGRTPLVLVRAEARPLNLVDILVTSFATFGAAYLVLMARWVPGWLPAALTLSVIELGPPVRLSERFPNSAPAVTPIDGETAKSTPTAPPMFPDDAETSFCSVRVQR